MRTFFLLLSIAIALSAACGCDEGGCGSSPDSGTHVGYPPDEPMTVDPAIPTSTTSTIGH